MFFWVIISISPNYINFNDDITKFTLTFTKKIEPNIFNICFIREETNQTKLIFNTFNPQHNIIYLDSPKSSFNNNNNIEYFVGTYKISILKRNSGNPFISKKQLDV